MNNSLNKIEKSNLFATMFAEMENDDQYHVEGAKIEIAEQIYLLMQKKNVSQSDLARKLKMNRAYVSRILKGKTNFTVETLVKIGRQLEAEWDFRLAEHVAEKKRPEHFVETSWSDRIVTAKIYLMGNGNESYEEVLMGNG
ncbi:MAG TPA: helix-turn-helix transcriptional regulator [Candidatus Rifleibacterium sp.]|nr:helix-turn-helix transcriptional regulator [Candidatus Rifleibacterium sp.]